MKKNMGLLDRVIRLIVVLLVVLLLFKATISGVLGWIIGLICLFLVITALIGYCPLYSALKISTLKEKKSK